MFTGLISDIGMVERVEEGDNLHRLRIACSYLAKTLMPGGSIACGGPCLTVAACGENGARSWFEADVGAETLTRTNARHWKAGTNSISNGRLKSVMNLAATSSPGMWMPPPGLLRSQISMDCGASRSSLHKNLSRFIAEKGSVALDGTSLTVNSVEGDIFSILLIPHTLKVTTWGERHAGDEINIEIDLMARYAARLAESRAAAP